MGERFADVNVVDRVAHGGGGVMVWAGICYVVSVLLMVNFLLSDYRTV